MAEYRLVISGYGKSIAIGSLDKDLHFFWRINDPETTKTQLFREAYTLEKNPGQIDDTGDPLYLPIWKDNDNILSESGLYSDSIHVFVYDQNDNIIWASDRVDYWISKTFDQTEDLESGYYLKSWRERKGEFGVSVFSDNVFQENLLSCQAVKLNEQEIITEFYYNKKLLEIIPSEFGGISVNYDFFRIK